MDVSIIIVNYNTCELTRNCIDSVFMQTKDVEFEVILVDNASTDGSVEYFESDSRLMFVKSNINLGFGRANNLGYQYASGKYIFLLNSDTILLNNAVKIFYDRMQDQQNDIACLGCNLENIDGSIIHSYGNFPTIINELIRKPFAFLRILNIDRGFDSKPFINVNKNVYIVEYVTGADLFIRRDVIDLNGFFDEEFFMYYEEVELQYRYRKSGYFSAITVGPRIVHLEGGSDSNNIKKSGKIICGLMLCYKKMHGNFRKNIFKIIFWSASVFNMFFNFHYTIKQRIDYLKLIWNN